MLLLARSVYRCLLQSTNPLSPDTAGRLEEDPLLPLPAQVEAMHASSALPAAGVVCCNIVGELFKLLTAI